jgi:hypothetical protein
MSQISNKNNIQDTLISEVGTTTITTTIIIEGEVIIIAGIMHPINTVKTVGEVEEAIGAIQTILGVDVTDHF